MSDERTELERQVDRMFGLDPATGQLVEERPFGHLTDEQLEDELAKAEARLAVITEPAEDRAGEQLLRAALGDDVVSGLKDNAAFAELEARAMVAMGVPLITVPKAQVEQWQADARAFDDEIERTLAEQRQREAADRTQRADEADRLWPAYRDHLGWGWME